MVDKNFCMSSYMAFRYIEKDDVDFYEGMKHKNIVPLLDEEKTLVSTADEIDQSIQAVFDETEKEHLGILLSGGMDSAILASYMQGQDAYTFRFLGGDFQVEELKRAEYYAGYYGLRLHYVDIDWNVVEKNLDIVMKAKCAPVHSIEPQIYEAAIQAKKDGVTKMIIGESSDLIFGGMNQLLSRDWTVEEFEKRYVFTEPKLVLSEPVDMHYVFERYRRDEKIDFLRFIDDIFSIESSSSYYNAFGAADMQYLDPYAGLKMRETLDLNRVRNGEPKYLIRELFAKKYPNCPVPDKIPMPRPVNVYFEDWVGSKRSEFKAGLQMNEFTGNQKWQMYCLERFLEIYEQTPR